MVRRYKRERYSLSLSLYKETQPGKKQKHIPVTPQNVVVLLHSFAELFGETVLFQLYGGTVYLVLKLAASGRFHDHAGSNVRHHVAPVKLPHHRNPQKVHINPTAPAKIGSGSGLGLGLGFGFGFGFGVRD